MRTGSVFVSVAITILLLAVASAIYLPGISGPFLFDDFTNFLTNGYIKLREINADTLYKAAFSMNAGPLHRPIAMLSFGLNYYFAGGFDDPTPFKATNIAIHALNGVLAFWFVSLILERLQTTRKGNYTYPQWFAGGVALLWVVHPIQLTSVLYVVQRMTSLSATFVLLGLIAYVYGRVRLAGERRGGIVLIVIGITAGTALSIFSKEIGVLLPLFALLIEITLFSNEKPWCRWNEIPTKYRVALIALLAAAFATSVVWAVNYASGGYVMRSFTMGERVLTETRVLWQYLTLLAIPSLHSLALYHDDITISSSLFAPWTTLPAAAGIVVLLVLGFLLQKKHPLLSFGILWFFVGHALESTIFSLEIAYEHRNYLPSLGIMIVAVEGIRLASAKVNSWRPWLIVPLLVIAYGTVTFIRSGQWSDLVVFAAYEAEHHPDSARAQGYLGKAFAERRRYGEAAEAFRRAAQLDPAEPAYLMAIHLIPPESGFSPTSSERLDTVKRLTARPISASTMIVLQTVDTYLIEHYPHVQKSMEDWATALVNADLPGKDNSFCYYLLGRSLAAQGRTEEALRAFRTSLELDPKYLHPRMEIVRALLSAKRLREANQALLELQTANAASHFPRDAEINTLSSKLVELSNAKPSVR